MKTSIDIPDGDKRMRLEKLNERLRGSFKDFMTQDDLQRMREDGVRHRIVREVQADETRTLEPISKNELMRSYRKLSRTEREEEKAMVKASARPVVGELE